MMKHLLASLIALALVSTASAHFPYLIPGTGNQGKAIFSDNLKPDPIVSIERIAQTKLTLMGDTKEIPLTFEKASNSYTFEVPGSGNRVVNGTTDLGIVQRGESKPFRLLYYPKAIFGELSDKVTVGSQLPIELVPVREGDKLRLKVLIGGKPTEKIDVTVLIPGEEKGKVFVTDHAGLTPPFDKGGTYGAQCRWVEAKAGEVAGKKYDETRHYATLVVNLTK
jgi:uncharacterized GH25 family protein